MDGTFHDHVMYYWSTMIMFVFIKVGMFLKKLAVVQVAQPKIGMREYSRM